MISLSYSRISLADIAQKLQLDSPEDAEFIVAKVGLGQELLPQAPAFLLVSGSEWEEIGQRGTSKAVAQSLQECQSFAEKPGSCQKEYGCEFLRV